MSGQLYRDPDEVIREAEQRDEELERQQESEQEANKEPEQQPGEERGHGERWREPDATDDEMSEDNDGGPPAGRRR